MEDDVKLEKFKKLTCDDVLYYGIVVKSLNSSRSRGLGSRKRERERRRNADSIILFYACALPFDIHSLTHTRNDERGL